jgi:hypothetical protein
MDNFRCCGRTNHHRSQFHQPTTIPTTPPRHTKHSPQQLRPRNMSGNCWRFLLPNKLEMLLLRLWIPIFGQYLLPILCIRRKHPMIEIQTRFSSLLILSNLLPKEHFFSNLVSKNKIKISHHTKNHPNYAIKKSCTCQALTKSALPYPIPSGSSWTQSILEERSDETVKFLL